jgi:hypothetical protein
MSGSKNILKQYHSVINGDMSAVITSPITDISFLDNIGIQLDFSGSPSGSFAIQISADYSQDASGNVKNAGSWVPLVLTYFTGSAFTSATSVPTYVGSPIYLDLTQLSAPYIRVVYTPSGGSGALNVYVTAKML